MLRLDSVVTDTSLFIGCPGCKIESEGAAYYLCKSYEELTASDHYRGYKEVVGFILSGFV